MSTPELSFVLPLYRTAEHIDELLRRIDAVAEALSVAHEVVLVDDSCPAGSGERAELASRRHASARVIHLPENIGQDGALRAGMRESRGDWIVLLDADLQDPPEAVPLLWAARADHDVIFARRTGQYTSRGRHLTSMLYRRVTALIGDLPYGACLFVLLRRNIALRVAATRRPRASILATIAAARPACTIVPITRAPRPSGNSAYNARRRIAKAATSLCEMLLARRLHQRL